MAKGLHFFPLYYQRLLTSTVGWEDDEFGAYLRLLIYQFDKGYVPADIKEIKKITKIGAKKWEKIGQKFELNAEGFYVNYVMNEIRDEAIRNLNNSILNGKKGGRPKKGRVFTEKGSGFPTETQNEPEPLTINQYKENIQTEKWNSKPGKEEMSLELPEIKCGAVIEYLAITKNMQVNSIQVNRLWTVFKQQYFNGEKFYQSKNDVYSHFINWSQKKNIESFKKETTKEQTFNYKNITRE